MHAHKSISERGGTPLHPKLFYSSPRRARARSVDPSLSVIVDPGILPLVQYRHGRPCDPKFHNCRPAGKACPTDIRSGWNSPPAPPPFERRWREPFHRFPRWEHERLRRGWTSGGNRI